MLLKRVFARGPSAFVSVELSHWRDINKERETITLNILQSNRRRDKKYTFSIIKILKSLGNGFWQFTM